MKQLRQHHRPLLLLCAMLVALAPLSASAKEKTEQQKKAEMDNRAARCGMLLAGVEIKGGKGKLTKEECTAFTAALVGGTSVGARALTSLPVTAPEDSEKANRAARCKAQMAGEKSPGYLRPDECAAYLAQPSTGEVRALSSLPGPKCPHPGQPLTKLERANIAHWAHAKAKALKKGQAEPAPSDELSALLAC